MISPMKKIATFLLSGMFVAVFLGSFPMDADALGGRGGAKGGGGFKGKTRTNVGGNRAHRSKKTSRPVGKSDRKISNSGNRKKVDIDNSKRNINIDNSKDIDIDVDRHGGCCYGGYYDHPVGTAVAVGVTAAVIGSIVYSLPSSCVTTVVGNVSYRQCGNTWYQPQYNGGDVTYVVVNNPN